MSLKQTQVKTGPPTHKQSTPRLPHEHDESEDSQARPPESPSDDIKQAYRDLQNGQVDTDLRASRGVDAVVNKTLVVSQVESVGKKSMDFFDWQGARRPHGEPCNDEQRGQAEKDAIYSRRFNLTDH